MNESFSFPGGDSFFSRSSESILTAKSFLKVLMFLNNTLTAHKFIKRTFKVNFRT